ncbi:MULTISPECIES: biotin transporter BioY [unclassified Lentilitoribacter]|uniref:biotin transporter BioY n=1 Tax=unclassified Lentilitoribacter TaxID=2647570 RepID=UPI0013A6DC55|nr:biotin transporter BioY [Lentilitoribacter sp. Alg239-R112]
MSTRDIVLIALFAAITAVLGVFPPLTLPVISVPITAQTLGVMLAGGVLGAKRGALSMVLFLVLVAVGLPLLSGGRGGFAVFFGPSGGFLIGWIFAAYCIGMMIDKFWNKLNYFSAFVACFTGGIVLLYLIGIPWVAFAAKIPLSKAFIGSMSFVPGDIIKTAIASWVIVTVAKSYPIMKPA